MAERGGGEKALTTANIDFAMLCEMLYTMHLLKFWVKFNLVKLQTELRKSAYSVDFRSSWRQQIFPYKCFTTRKKEQKSMVHRV